MDAKSPSTLTWWIKELLVYFEKEYMNDIHFWNVSKADARTNNVFEGNEQKLTRTPSFFTLSQGYHIQIKYRIHRNHPNIWVFINFLKNEE